MEFGNRDLGLKVINLVTHAPRISLQRVIYKKGVTRSWANDYKQNPHGIYTIWSVWKPLSMPAGSKATQLISGLYRRGIEIQALNRQFECVVTGVTPGHIQVQPSPHAIFKIDLNDLKAILVAV